MNSSLLTPSSSSSSPHHLQSPATFDHDDFLQNFFSSAPWPSSVLEDDAPPPTSETAVTSFHHHDVDSRNQITMIPLSHHNPNDAVDVNALYSGFSAGSLPFHFPQGSGGGVMKQSHTPTQSQATASTTTGGTGATPQTKPKVRARRGQATDPHSIAERVRFFFFLFSLIIRVQLPRKLYVANCAMLYVWGNYLKYFETMDQLRRERIAERMKSLQELVPNGNKVNCIHDLILIIPLCPWLVKFN